MAESLQSQLHVNASVPEQSQYAAIINSLTNKQIVLENKYEVLENTLGINPLKALSVILLRNEIDNIKIRQTKLSYDIEQQVNRIYDQNKWFIGLFLTMAISIIGLVVSNLYQVNKKEISKVSSQQDEPNNKNHP